jgi:hypothetical protein
MMGPKTLSEIREELRRALAATGDDPLRWLEKRMTASSKRRGKSEVLQSLWRFLNEGKRGKPRKHQAGNQT